MTKEQLSQVIEALVEFTTKVAKGKATSETEIAVLPEVVRVLLEITQSC